MTWADMSEAERVEAIRSGLIAGRSYAQIAAPLRTTKEAVLGYAWRRSLNAANAEVWAPRKLRQCSTHEELSRKRKWKPRARKPRSHVSMEARRGRLPNKGKNERTRAGVALINAMLRFDTEIAKDLRIDVGAIRKWRGGRWGITPFMLKRIETLAQRGRDVA